MTAPACRFLSALTAAVPLAATVVVATAGPAVAAFPGSNGMLAFTSTEDGGACHIFVASGSQIADLTGATSAAVETQPQFSPDGHEIVFTRFASGLPNTEIFVMAANGTNRFQLTATGQGNSDPTWSPDGRWIAFESLRGRTPDIYVMRSDGTDVQRVTDDSATESELAWSPTGSTLAFVRVPAGGGDRDIYRVNLDGRGLADLTNDPGANDVDPAWSPDGTHIAYSSAPHPTGSEGGDLWVMDGGGAAQTPLQHESNGYSDGAFPAWSPDGSTIAFTANNGSGYYHVWSVPAAGGDNTELVTNRIDGSNPGDEDVDWQPAPTYVAPPATKLTGAAVSVKKRWATFRFTAGGIPVGYQCALRRGRGAVRFAPCRAPIAYRKLRKGRYTFEVRAVGPGGTDRSSAKKSFRIS